MVSNLPRSLTYSERLAKCGLTTITERMARGDAIEVFKTLTGVNNIDYRQFWTLSSEVGQGEVASQTRARTGYLNLQRKDGNTEQRRNCWSVRSVGPWNSLNIDTKQATSKDSFNARYDKEMIERTSRAEK